jgi:hypothetical protein
MVIFWRRNKELKYAVPGCILHEAPYETSKQNKHRHHKQTNI